MNNFPLVDKKGKLYDRFPYIRIRTVGGQSYDYYYFDLDPKQYVPRRYMPASSDGFIPNVKYTNYFMSEQEVMKMFLNAHKKRSEFLFINGSMAIQWSNIDSLEVVMDGNVICFGEVEWNESKAIIKEEPYVVDISDIDLTEDVIETRLFDSKKEIEDYLNSLKITDKKKELMDLFESK